MKLFETATCSSLPQVSPDLSRDIQCSEKTPQEHRALFARLDALHLLETGGEMPMPHPLADRITVMAWNLQRCLFPEQSADLLRPHDPDVILLSEMDIGMARTHQRHTVRALADSLGMRYAFGVEFFELGLGNDLERRLAADDHNNCGWHGNALLCRQEPDALALIRLDESGLWFCPEDGLGNDSVAKQPRVGGRCAIAAILPSEAGTICVASAHLESLDDPSIRLSQMERLIAALDGFAPGLPTIIGGDLNTAFTPEGGGTKEEPLFRAAERHGFSWANNAKGTTTRRSLLTYKPRPPRKLDWLCARGFVPVEAAILPAIEASGKALSDHEIILGRYALPNGPQDERQDG
ncbi:endonuclease/exonuclease/phosphatase family protein [Cohaesibacter haloalkalitolerans]|uniref:endonuclease/exonuclease/phosphatase family protein n=1 Tax=Cohaesibacter haloalkalitolerans TaxID=1162980 RepID=UPI000E64D680|nr:endonuclease/exonuclease/phosphatase family protein [Cohaesibacter haloalkalitolerans]